MYIDRVFVCCFTSSSPLKPCLRDAQQELARRGVRSPPGPLQRQALQLLQMLAGRLRPLRRPDKIWCANIMEEFYALGDKERDLGLSVTDIFRREKSVQEVQTGFTKFFVRPLFVALGDIEGFDMQRPLDRIEENLAYWDSTTSSKK